MAEQSNRHLFTIVQRAVEHQQRWLLYMDHCDSCPDSKQCSMAACSSGKATFEHARRCKGSCKFPNCAQLQLLLKHKGICTGQKVRWAWTRGILCEQIQKALLRSSKDLVEAYHPSYVSNLFSVTLMQYTGRLLPYMCTRGLLR